MADVWWYEQRKCWCADVPDMRRPGKRTRLYFGDDKDHARSELHRYLADYHAHRPAKRKQGQALSLAALTARFLDWCETNRSPSTNHLYALQLKAFLEEHGAQAAEDITPADVEEHKGRIKKRRCQPRTINLFVQIVKRLFNWGVEQGLLKDSPIRNVKRVPKAPLKDKSLKAREIEGFFHYAHQGEPVGQICEVLLDTGMRVGELLKLKWSDIDFEQRLARVFEHKTAHRGEQRPRTIPLNDRVIEIFEKQPRISKAVFTGEGKQPLTYTAVKCRKTRLEKKYPDMPHVTFHQFRHTFATRLAQTGTQERVAQAILGHSSTVMTRYYTTTSPEEMLKAVQKLEE